MWCSDPFSFAKYVSLFIDLMYLLSDSMLSLIITHSLFLQLSKVSQLPMTPFFILFLPFTAFYYLMHYKKINQQPMCENLLVKHVLRQRVCLNQSLGLHFMLSRWVTWSNCEVICISNLFSPDHFLPSKARHFDVPQISLQPDYLTGEADFAALRHVHKDEG